MRRLSKIPLSLLLVVTLAAGQQSGPTPPSAPKDIKPERVKVYAAGPGMAAPALISTYTLSMPETKCGKKIDSKVELSLLIDTTGRPRNLMFVHPLGNDLDKLALRIVASDRFTPATRDGAPVVMAETVKVNMHGCVDSSKNDTGNKIYLRLQSHPERKYQLQSKPYEDAVLAPGDGSWDEAARDHVAIFRPGLGISPPAVLNNPQAEYTEEARRAGFTGSCSLSMIVDAQGMPQDVQLLTPLGYGLEQQALNVAMKYRFRPAMRNHEPVPYKITVEATFRLY